MATGLGCYVPPSHHYAYDDDDDGDDCYDGGGDAAAAAVEVEQRKGERCGCFGPRHLHPLGQRSIPTEPHHIAVAALRSIHLPG